ncbi:hypothetical protein [Spiroplasma melliferum]|uniref:Transmembrane protein n=2 Tax=Spiroplasma melliferum TaxID=2134 RepID=A0AAI9X178_SPIME|nr:hypothetical protein [Spiroplasma melliferum]ELL44663.1 hypothetical protein SMIPMB4A_v3c4060 [Spiroplasma melliferum IPMB4A]KAI92966.1 hypothetical protein SPM_003040 [Spiroplasma melliferum KC3]QCO23861.1 hypothetical protein SRED_002339 [Spiroplasma melliferum]
MNHSYLIGIILFSTILGGAIIIVAILALFQQQKIKDFKQKKNELQTMIDNHQQFLNATLVAIQIKYELPKNEICYYQAPISGYEITKQKELKQNVYYLTQQMKEQYYVEYLTGYLNLTTSNSKETINGIIYVTNYRLVFQIKDENLLIWLKDINFVLPSVFNLNGFYQIGFFISTTEKIYRFITNDVKISMTIFKTWQQNRGG